MMDYLIRAESWAVWQTYAKDQGWLVETDNVLHAAPGVLVDEIGPVVLTPAVIDAETFEITTPAVMDEWHHVNLRLLDPPEDIATKMADGKLVTTDPHGIDAVEFGIEPTRVQVLDASDIETPVRMWADGMHFPEGAEAKPGPKTTKKKAKAKARK